MNDLRQRVSEELLPFVRQPGQYIGGEINSLPRDWEAADARIALAFPDTYAIGMSHLGCAILYWIANHIPGVACERVFSPWLDAQARMRQAGIPLFTWESRRPVASADILAISLQYEMNFTNVLDLLDLAGIPLHAQDRFDSPAHKASGRPFGPPLVIAGGPQADNPEPLADFIDLFVIGDGEHAIAAMIEDVRELKRAGASRGEALREIARRHEWAYVPSLYDVAYHADGTVASLTGPGHLIRRCRTPDFETVDFPTAPVIPWTETVHERFNIEIMRGCPQRCRFCQAGHTRHPLVWRSVGRIMQLAEQGVASTGYDEIALTSLSTSDYPHLAELMEQANAAFGPRRVSISVPSLRVNKQLAFIPWQTAQVRKSGLTIAVEAARESMRRLIGKKVADVDLLAGVRAAYQAGWRSVKLYFMVGFPGETEEDIRGIVELAREVSAARRSLELGGESAGRRAGPASVTVSVSPLVPKPHTPFQWIAQRDGDYFHWARTQLRSQAIGSTVHVNFHRIERSLLEAVFARGDRRVGRAIEIAWRAGARFDGWDEGFDHDRWMRAFAEAGLDPAFYAHRDRPIEEVLPWDHIESGPGRAHLERQARHWREQLEALARGEQV